MPKFHFFYGITNQKTPVTTSNTTEQTRKDAGAPAQRHDGKTVTKT